MSGFLTTLNVFIAAILIVTVLLQPGSKGGGLGSSFGGGGANSAFGARGSAPFLAKLTYWLAGGFLISCVFIEILIVKENRSVLDRKRVAPVAGQKVPAPAPPQVPVLPPQK